MEFKKKLQKEKKEEQRKQRVSLPIQQQSKLRSHDMKRSLKAARFSDFAFLILTSCSVLIFSWRVPVFIFSFFQSAAKNSFSYRLKSLSDVT